MGTLTVTLPDGRSGTLSMPADQDEAFSKLSAQEQQDVVAKALPSFSDNFSIADSLKGGLNDLGTGVSTGLKAVGGVMSRNGMPDWGGNVSGAGKWVEGITPDTPSGRSPTEALAGTLRGEGSWRDAPNQLLHAGVRAIPSLVPMLGAAAVGGPIAAGATAGALALGPTAYGRAANNGREEPTTADIAEAVPGAAFQGVAGAFVPMGAKVAAIANTGARTAARTAVTGAAGAGMEAANQVGSTLGTDKGLSIDPAMVAAGGLAAGTVGTALSAPGVAGDGLKRVSDRIVGSTLEPLDTPQSQRSVVQVTADMATIRDNAVKSGSPLKEVAVANSLKSEYVRRLGSISRAWQEGGLITPDSLRDLTRLVEGQAQRHNNTIAEGSDGVSTLFSQLDGLKVPEAEMAAFRDSVVNLNTVSSQSFQNNSVGPLKVAGRVLGNWGPAVAAAAHGDLTHMGVAMLGHNISGKVGEKIGAMGDRAFGLDTPPVLLQAAKARRLLKAAGENPDDISGSLPGLTGARESAMRRAGLLERASKLTTQRDLAAEGAADDAVHLLRRTEVANKREAKDRVSQLARMEAQKAQQDTAAANKGVEVGKAWNSVEQPRPPSTEIDAYLAGDLRDPSIVPPGKDLTTHQEVAIHNQRLRNQQLKEREEVRQGALLKKVDEQAQAPEIADADLMMKMASRDSLQAKRDLAVKARQLNAMVRQKAAQTKPEVPDPVPPSEIDAYLAGDLSDPSLPPTGKPMTTAQEVALYEQSLRNKTLLGKTESLQKALYGKAFSGSIEAKAQDRLDKATRLNATKLAADGMAPAERADVPAEATAAAVQDAARQAQKVRDTAGDATDRALVGSPLVDPVPVNVPLGRSGKTKREALAKKAVEASETAAAPPSNPVEASQSPAGGSWKGYVAHGDPNITPEVIAKALRIAEERGLIDPREAKHLEGHQGAYDAKRLRGVQSVAREIAYGGSGGDPQAGSSGIRNPLSYKANLLQEKAVSENIAAAHPNLIDAVNAIRDPDMNGKTKAGRLEVLEALLLDIPDATEKARVRAILKPLTGYGQGK